MCSRYEVDLATLQGLFALFHGLALPQQLPLEQLAGEIAPSLPGAVVRSLTAGGVAVAAPRWGFTAGGHGAVINARAETIRERALFRDSFALRRCLIPATRFFEWDATAAKNKYAFTRADGAPLLLAGCWRTEQGGARFVVLTREANRSMAPVHERMPVLVAPQNAAAYLTSEAAARQLVAAEGPPLHCTGAGDTQQLTLGF